MLIYCTSRLWKWTQSLKSTFVALIGCYTKGEPPTIRGRAQVKHVEAKAQDWMGWTVLQALATNRLENCGN